jgi:DNA-binding NarL/FixJ family response regulator
MTTSHDVSRRPGGDRSTRVPSAGESVLDEARSTIVRTAALLAAHRDALETLRASNEANARIRGRGGVHAEPGAEDASEHADGPLTPRQLEILGYLADGLNTSEIAARVSLSPATVRNHVRGIFTGLGCHSRLEAVATARKLGLLRG